MKTETDVLKILSNLVEIPSYGVIDRNHPIIEYLKRCFADCCETVEVEDKNGNVHLLIGVNHKLSNLDKCIVLSGHIDTVKECIGHDSKIDIEDSKVRGLGTSDMKAFIATIIANLEHFKNMDCPIVVSITSDEETNLLGIEKNVQEMKLRNIKPSMTIVGEPTDLNYYISSKGNSIYVSVMKGIASHSGTPELGINAIELQTQFIYEIMKMRERHLDDAAICITHINGGNSPSNVVPDNCSTCFGIRTSDTKVLDQIYKYLKLKYEEISSVCPGAELFNVLAIPPFEKRQSEFLSQHALEEGKELIDAKYSTEAGYFQQAFNDSEIVIYGPGNPESIHKTGEYIDINNLLRYDIELKEFINKYLKFINYKGTKKLVYKPKCTSADE